MPCRVPRWRRRTRRRGRSGRRRRRRGTRRTGWSTCSATRRRGAWRASSVRTTSAASLATSVPVRPHRDADVRGLQRRRVVHTFAGHGDDVAAARQRSHDHEDRGVLDVPDGSGDHGGDEQDADEPVAELVEGLEPFGPPGRLGQPVRSVEGRAFGGLPGAQLLSPVAGSTSSRAATCAGAGWWTSGRGPGASVAGAACAVPLPSTVTPRPSGRRRPGSARGAARPG